jgi:hypothetical protein
MKYAADKAAEKHEKILTEAARLFREKALVPEALELLCGSRSQVSRR